MNDDADKLHGILTRAADALAAEIGAAVGGAAAVSAGCLQSADAAPDVAADRLVIRTVLDGDRAGKSLVLVVTGTTELAALHAAAGKMCVALDAVIRECCRAGVQLDECDVVRAGADGSPLLGAGATIRFDSELQLDGTEAGRLSIRLDRVTAEAWNGRPLDTHDFTPQSALEEDVPVRGRIACYLGDSEPFDLVRRASRRAGLSIDHRPPSEVPNPAAYRDRLVLIDVPVREERRFEWCKRLKEYEPSCRVLLMVRQPSRQRVVQGFLAKADLIVGWPLEQAELVAKLDELFESLGVETSPVGDQ